MFISLVQSQFCLLILSGNFPRFLFTIFGFQFSVLRFLVSVFNFHFSDSQFCLFSLPSPFTVFCFLLSIFCFLFSFFCFLFTSLIPSQFCLFTLRGSFPRDSSSITWCVSLPPVAPSRSFNYHSWIKTFWNSKEREFALLIVAIFGKSMILPFQV